MRYSLKIRYCYPSELLPAEHNVFDEKSWQTWGLYTITEEDYQRALVQSGK